MEEKKETQIDFIDRVRGSVVVSIAHTAADYDTAVEAIEQKKESLWQNI